MHAAMRLYGHKFDAADWHMGDYRLVCCHGIGLFRCR